MGKFVVESEGHFFVSSVAEWRTGTDIEKLIKAMKSGGFPFKVIWVPLPEKAHYSINYYAPEVEGCILLASYNKE